MNFFLKVVCLLTRGHLKSTRRRDWDWHLLLAEGMEFFWHEHCNVTLFERQIKLGLKRTKQGKRTWNKPCKEL